MEGSGDAGVVLAASGTHVARGARLPVCSIAHWVMHSLCAALEDMPNLLLKGFSCM